MLATLALPMVCMRMRLKPSTARQFFDIQAWTELPFVIFAVACFVGFIGLYIPYFFIQTYASQTNIVDRDVAIYLVPMLNAGALVGRLVSSVANQPDLDP